MSLVDTSKIDEEYEKGKLVEKEEKKKVQKEIADKINPKKSKFSKMFGDKIRKPKPAPQQPIMPSKEELNDYLNYDVVTNEIVPVQSELMNATYGILSLPIKKELRTTLKQNLQESECVGRVWDNNMEKVKSLLYGVNDQALFAVGYSIAYLKTLSII
jgi:hypothetical protein